MTTKKQEKALELAKCLLLELPDLSSPREWENLWEDGENNSNALLLALMDLMEDREYREAVIKNAQYMPRKLLEYATFKAGEHETDKKYAKVFSGLLEDIENLFNTIDKELNYTKPYDIMNNEKWEGLYKYNIEPLRGYLDNDSIFDLL